MLDNITWFGHDTFRITGGCVVYTDPYKIKRADTADIILITHSHFDHCSPDDVAKVIGDKTVIVATKDCAAKLRGNIKIAAPGDFLTAAGVEIEAVPAYNTNKSFHPKSNRWVGYIFTLDGKRYYLAGDTDYIVEMRSIRDIYAALLPVSGTYVMTADEAARAALDIAPQFAVPMHYGDIVGTKKDAERFADEIKRLSASGPKIETVILPCH
ncbi:MBL fold metallo-hydrolase [Candidatus Magnetominusculus dajiuhuensis]|uniref:MBL fold metallo-hydrolase n=1 Tax=Candidatus Magnetominusculus dajiuhuensis TaxID=3137712 RepID=UPI003B43885B